MKVSVIIRTFNRAHCISNTIQSALQQTYTDLEFIVVDDGSTDGTDKVLRSFHDGRLRVISHESNRGVGAACNTGVAAATGDLVAWLDSDDVWHPSKTEQQVEFLRKYRGVDAVFSDVCVRERDKYVLSLIEHMPSFSKGLRGKTRGTEFVVGQREMYLCLLEEVPIKPTALLVRRGVFGKVGLFNESARSGEDWEFFLRLAHHSSFGYIDRPLAEMTRSSDSTFERFRLEDKAFLAEVFTREREDLKHDAQAFEVASRGLRHHFKHLGYCHLERGKLLKAAATYLRGYRLTGDTELILQAGAAFVPFTFRKQLMRRVKATS